MMFDEESNENIDEESGQNIALTIEQIPNTTLTIEKVQILKNAHIPNNVLIPNGDNISAISSEGLNTSYIIDNLAPTWGIMLTVQDNLNLRIGVQVKKKYFNAAFWNYISTPINFTITLFTALSAAQTGSSASFLSQNQLFYVLITSFILSIVNTFFKLREKADINYKSAKMWESYAAAYERIYFTPIGLAGDVRLRLDKYNELIEKINCEYVEETVEYVNYITELIFYCCQLCRKNTDYRFLSLRQRHWILDGVSYEKYMACLAKHPDKDIMSSMITTEVDSNIFRKELVKMADQRQIKSKFMGFF